LKRIPAKKTLPCPVTTPAKGKFRASFALAFRSWRQKSQIPLKQIASDLGVSTSTVSAWELGERFPSGDHFERLVEYTGLPPCRLFCVMTEECVPADCLQALSRLSVASPRSPVRSSR